MFLPAGVGSPIGGWDAAFAAGRAAHRAWCQRATGYRVPLTDEQTGNVTITTQAEADDMQGVHFSSSIVTFANSSPLVVRNTKVTLPQNLGISNHYNALHFPNGVDDVDIWFTTARGWYQRAGSAFGGTSYGQRIKFHYCDFAQFGDDAGKMFKDGLLEYSWIHDMLEWNTALFGPYNSSANNVEFPHLDGPQVLRGWDHPQQSHRAAVDSKYCRSGDCWQRCSRRAARRFAD